MKDILLLLGGILVSGFIIFSLIIFGVYLITSGLGIPFSPKYVLTVIGIYILIVLGRVRVNVND